MTQPDPDRLADIAVGLVTRVRDEGPAENARWLALQLPNPQDWFRLAFVLAAAIPDDQAWLHLTSWAHHLEEDTIAPVLTPNFDAIGPDGRRPCGTVAAARRHRYHGEPPCQDCLEAERTRDRNRKRAARRAVA